jgi:YbbR domain-containing protein
VRKRRFFRKDWVLKLISLGFALILWFFVVGEEKSEIAISVPIEIVNVPGGLIIANDIPPALDVRLYGPRSLIRAMATQRLSKVINLEGASAGNITLHIAPDSLPVLGGVRVIRVQPSSLEIILDRIERKEFPVSAVVTGRVAPDYEMGAVEVTPNRVMLVGPSSQMNDMTHVETLPVDLSGATNTFSKRVALDLQDVTVASGQVDAVEVKVHIKAIQGTRRITAVPVRLETTATGVSWTPKTVAVVVEGAKVGLRGMEAGDIDAKISVDGLNPGTYKVEPKCVVPQAFSVKEVIPKVIRVTIPKRSSGK